MSRHTFASSFLQSVPVQLSRPCRHPSIRTLCERYSLGARWVFSFSRCCYHYARQYTHRGPTASIICAKLGGHRHKTTIKTKLTFFLLFRDHHTPTHAL